MKFARVVNNQAVDVRSDSPEGCFTPNIVAEFVQVPDEVMDKWVLNAGVWSAPPVIPPHVPTAAEILAALNALKGAKRIEIHGEAEKYLNQETLIDGSPMSVRGAALLVGDAARNPHAIKNITTKAGSIPLSAAAIASINTLVDAREIAIEANSAALNLLVTNATTQQEVNDIDVSVGWP